MLPMSIRQLHYQHTAPVYLETGGRFDSITVAYQTWGVLNSRKDNAVLVLHAFTGDTAVTSNSVGDSYPVPRGWWETYVGPGKPIDTDRWFVVAPNVLGGCAGTTGPSSPAPDGAVYGSRFPRITIRDQVSVEALLTNHLNIERYALVAGGSMGGMRVLEWCLMFPDRVAAAWVGVSGAFTTAEQIALHTLQIQAIMNDPNWCGGDYAAAGVFPAAGLGFARRLALLSYRTEDEFALRFARDVQPGENPWASTPMRNVGEEGYRFAVQGYLDYQASKLVKRFDAGTYVVLADAMMTHDVGRGRGGVAHALNTVTTPMTVTGVRSDRLYPLRLQQQIVDLVPTAEPLHVMDALQGHDSFLLPDDGLAEMLRRTLKKTTTRRGGVPQPAGNVNCPPPCR